MKKRKGFYNPFTGEVVQSKPLNLKVCAVRYFRADCNGYCTIKWRDIQKIYF